MLLASGSIDHTRLNLEDVSKSVKESNVNEGNLLYRAKYAYARALSHASTKVSKELFSSNLWSDLFQLDVVLPDGEIAAQKPFSFN